eukprot:5357724-Ditylum_brightwellii.AAC.1
MPTPMLHLLLIPTTNHILRNNINNSEECILERKKTRLILKAGKKKKKKNDKNEEDDIVSKLLQDLKILSPSQRAHHAVQTCTTCHGTGLLQRTPHDDDDAIPATKENKFHVSIVGGGMSGAALCLALKQRNISCTLFEKDGSVEERLQGYGLTMQQGFSALSHLGLISSSSSSGDWCALLEGAIKSTHHVVFNHD